jgi:hypothetical protein
MSSEAGSIPTLSERFRQQALHLHLIRTTAITTAAARDPAWSHRALPAHRTWPTHYCARRLESSS